MILVDSDVLIDDALDRYPHSVDSKEFLERVEQTQGYVYIAWHTASNVYYIVARRGGDEFARRFIRRLLGFVDIATTTTEGLHYALELNMRDFEDAMQVAAAQACGAEYIVTRNIQDFVNSPIQAIEPQQALAELF